MKLGTRQTIAEFFVLAGILPLLVIVDGWILLLELWGLRKPWSHIYAWCIMVWLAYLLYMHIGWVSNGISCIVRQLFLPLIQWETYNLVLQIGMHIRNMVTNGVNLCMNAAQLIGAAWQLLQRMIIIVIIVLCSTI